MTSFIKIAEDIFLNDGGIPISGVSPGVYFLKFHPDYKKFYLKPTKEFKTESKIYGNIQLLSKRIVSTFMSRENVSTGVLLVGEKGSGKTMLSRLIAKYFIDELRLPVVLVDEPFAGSSFTSFITAIGPCMILFDEFEKTYDSSDDDRADAAKQILSFFDGTAAGHRLLIATANDEKKVDENMINRPGRLFYRIPFSGLDDNFINDYCQENLRNKTLFPSLEKVVAKVRKFNFDSLKALVEEMNRYDEPADTAVKFLNIIPSNSNKDYYTIIVKDSNGKILRNDADTTEWYGDPYQESNLYIPVAAILRKAQKGKKNEDGEDESDDQIDFYLGSQDLVKAEARSGVFIFKKNGFTVELHRNNSRFDYLAF